MTDPKVGERWAFTVEGEVIQVGENGIYISTTDGLRSWLEYPHITGQERIGEQFEIFHPGDVIRLKANHKVVRTLGSHRGRLMWTDHRDGSTQKCAKGFQFTSEIWEKLS